MIDAKGNIIGIINSVGTITGNLNKALEYVKPVTQEKEITPTRETQIVEPDDGFTGLSKVTIDGYVPNVINKSITKNGIYKASDDNVDGYDEVDIQTNGVDINDYINTKITTKNNLFYKYIIKIPCLDLSEANNCTSMFASYENLEEVSFSDTSKITSFYNMFYNCNKLKCDITLDLSSATNFVQVFNCCYNIKKITILNSDKAKFNTLNSTFRECKELVELSAIYASNVTVNNSTTFYLCRKLEKFGGLIDIGKKYETSAMENNTNYSLTFSTCSSLSHESLLNIINGLYDIATAGVKPQQLVLGTTNLAKLTEDEIAIATNKGWTVS